MKIAVLLTCFNRKIKTLSCLQSLYHALEVYNNKYENKIDLSIYLTDDGCTDGTGNAVRENFIDKDITILQGTGNLFWAGGMCLAWNTALRNNKGWDFYLLLNDDVDLLDNLFDELISTHQYSLSIYGKAGIYSGITSEKTDYTRMTYGGNVWVNKFLGKTRRLSPTGTPQLCDTTNANILLVHHSVVDKIGIFWDGYEHGASDYDYSCMARKAGFPVLITANFCGRCDNDHKSYDHIKQYLLSATLEERKKYFNNPVHSNKDQLTYIKRNVPFRYPLIYIGRILNLYYPKFYYWISESIRK